MGLFGKSVFSVFDVVKDIVDNSSVSSGGIYKPSTTSRMPDIHEPSINDMRDTVKKIKLLFTDVETEGQKRGYEKAAAEYEDAFAKIEEEYQTTKHILDDEITSKEAKADKLIAKLGELEKLKETLQKESKHQTQRVSNQYNIPLSKVTQSVAAGTLLVGGTSFSILDIICAKKEKKLIEAEEKGYKEARSEYRRKISDLKDNLNRLKAKSEIELAALMNLIAALIDEIAKEETKIAELRVLLD